MLDIFSSRNWQHHFSFPLAVYEDSDFPHPCYCMTFKNFSHSTEWKVVSHYGFDLHIPDD
jgi:hypothetical protein